MSQLTFFFLLKERILATCEANKLEYVDDPTNYQPQFTIRNAIRHCLNSEEKSDSAIARYPPDIAVQLKDINKAGAKYTELKIGLGASREHLREVVKKFAEELEDIDAKGLSSVIYRYCVKKLICLIQWMNFS
jgi:tRNA(Ile)-lysidine synthase